jgi:undecaprenyl pyrophosphate phosphatase UppP
MAESSADMAAAVGAGFTSSLIAGLAALGLLRYMLKSRGFGWFTVYRVTAGLLVVIVVVVVFR